MVEDEHKIAASLKKGLEQETYAVDVAFDGDTGLGLAAIEDYDLVVLDLMLPKLDGLTLCRKLRQEEHNHVPVLILTARGEVEDRVQGLDCGADDYLVKPFAFAELLARVRALTRRPKTSLSSQLRYKDLELDVKSFTVTRAGKPIHLSRKEFSLLEYFLRHPEKIITKDQLIAHVWDYDADILPNTVEVYVGYLRKKIDEPFRNEERYLQTVRGFGYRLGKGENV